MTCDGKKQAKSEINQGKKMGLLQKQRFCSSLSNSAPDAEFLTPGSGAESILIVADAFGVVTVLVGTVLGIQQHENQNDDAADKGN